MLQQQRPIDLTAASLMELFKNNIPAIDVAGFIAPSEMEAMINVIESHQIGEYNETVFPRIGSVGITQFEHQNDKKAYFQGVPAAKSLQQRFAQEANVDVLGRVTQALECASGLPVRVAREDEEKEYFAGLLRVINGSAQIHADFGPHDGPSWEIGRICSQITWNILLRPVQGGETIVYDRSWHPPSDDQQFRKPMSYGFSPNIIENQPFKVLTPQAGHLTLFNSRNFHEVKSLDKPHQDCRYTVSSFVGLLPASSSSEKASLILWS
ncbi:hypothetical protein FE257_005511 [Aspergillus nanangensis]|uniref:Prolyl 4-hydroxylase alpha subunit Fe(2+) 2OG dioxygenase domain-containing protein n=1 Tax=Aspergillus nanangensis TaxID=2582783 RepID=A0AAD4GNV8_ASPNN|nr:hypothetical protein FE257_005511 [Aspergillus nanangensis]